MLNPRQKYTLSLAVVVLILLVLFPPYFGIDIESEGRAHAFIGYSPVWSPPSPEQAYEAITSSSPSGVDTARLASFEVRLNVVRLGFNIIITMVVTIIAVVISRNRGNGA